MSGANSPKEPFGPDTGKNRDDTPVESVRRQDFFCPDGFQLDVTAHPGIMPSFDPNKLKIIPDATVALVVSGANS